MAIISYSTPVSAGSLFLSSAVGIMCRHRVSSSLRYFYLVSNHPPSIMEGEREKSWQQTTRSISWCCLLLSPKCLGTLEWCCII